jgi:signal transduction histidine kinase
MLAILATLIYFLVKLNRKYKEANLKLASQSQELEALNDQKDKFFSFVAHNLKNPFNTIMGFSELMQKSVNLRNFDKIKQYSSLIYNLSSQVQKVLSNLLEWSRLQRRTFEYKPEVLDLNCLVSDVIEMNNREAARKDLHLEYSGEDDVHTYADRTMITTVMQNLISNAVNFTPQGGRISVECRRRGNHVEVSVTDTGIGIPEEEIGRLFQYDIMKSKIGTGENKGAGLGLILCREMILRNNGDINVRSKPGKGSEFTFTLPGAEREASQDKDSTILPMDVVKELLSDKTPVPADVMTEINVKLSPRFREVSTILSLDNIAEFAEAVEETGSKNGISTLAKYGSMLKELLKNHQIDQIIKILPGFKEYLDLIGSRS